MFIHEYPYTDFNEYNLTWLIKTVRDLQVSMNDYEALHSITFGGDWDISKQYQAWTIVSDPNTHDGYLSLGPVPNNVPLTDTTYWLKIADYTTGLSAVNTRVDNVEDYITNTVDVEIGNLQNDVSTLQNAVNTINNTDIPNLDARLSLIENRKIVIVGDSYFRPSWDQIASSTGPIEFIESITDKFEFDNLSIGQTGFTSTPNNFSTILDTPSSFNADEVTDVFFLGGYNDRNSSVSAIMTAMQTTIAKAKTLYKNATVHVGHFGWSGTLASTARDAMRDNSIPAYRHAPEYGASYMTNCEYTMHYYELITHLDDIHPTDDGCKELAKQMIEYLLTGSCDVHYKYKSLTFNGAYNTSSTYAVGSQLDNDSVTIWIGDGSITFTTPPSIPTGDWTGILQLTDVSDGNRMHYIGIYDSAKYLAPEITLNGYMMNSNGTYSFTSMTPCSFRLSGGYLFIRPYGIKADGSGFIDYGECTQLRPIGGCFTIPTLLC